MNRFKRPAIFLSTAMAALAILLPTEMGPAFNAIAQSESPVRRKSSNESVRVTSPCPGEFPITALVVFNSEKGPVKNDMEGVRECGFNLCMQMTNADRTAQLLNYMEGIDLKYIASDLNFVIRSSSSQVWRNEMKQFIDKFKDNPKVAGWSLYDEPKWDQLRDLQQRYDYLRDIDSSRFVSINFVGELNKSFTGPCETLPVYLDSIQGVFGASLDAWSSDCYPIWIRNGQFRVRYKEFYEDLEAYSSKARETGIPMWTYCQSMNCQSGTHHTLPEATEPYLTFEAFSGLAYGSQGIVYWTYSTKPSNPAETFLTALIDFDGNRTPAWYAAQSVNRQIRALTPVFLGAEMVEVRHTGNIPLKDVRGLIEDFGPLSRLTNGEKGVLASHLRNNGKDYLLIVNHDVQNKQKVRLSFRKDASVMKITASLSGAVTRKNVGRVRNETLSPGGYALYEWQ